MTPAGLTCPIWSSLIRIYPTDRHAGVSVLYYYIIRGDSFSQQVYSLGTLVDFHVFIKIYARDNYYVVSIKINNEKRETTIFPGLVTSGHIFTKYLVPMSFEM